MPTFQPQFGSHHELAQIPGVAILLIVSCTAAVRSGRVADIQRHIDRNWKVVAVKSLHSLPTTRSFRSTHHIPNLFTPCLL